MAGTGGSGIQIDPMHQFVVSPLFSDAAITPISFTNSSLWMGVVVGLASLVFVAGASGRALVPTRRQSVSEVLYEFMRKTLQDAAGEEGLRYFPYIFTLFLFVLFSNLAGLLPYSFTVTSHIAVTAALALMVFVSVTAIAFWKHGMRFFSLFTPGGVKGPILLMLAPIEVISYLIRPVSHSVRLGANMLAGHAVLKVFAGFVAPMGLAGGLPLVAMVGLYGLELLVALVQAYIFAILTCIYLNDALHLH